MELKAGKLYILSGKPGSGKSFFLQKNIKEGNIEKEMVISSDQIRETLTGKLFKISIKNHVATRLGEQSNATVFSLIRTMIDEKLKQRLTVFLDATSISDKERGEFVKIARDNGCEAEILIIKATREECIENNAKRKRNIEEYVIDKFELQEDSIYPFRIISSKDKITLVPNELTEDKLDVVGDIHGLLSLFKEFISELGYEFKNDIPVHPEGRKILFLGDFIDRGPESIEALDFVFKAVTEGGHYAVRGNHEHKFIRTVELYEAQKELKGSIAVLDTFLNGVKKFKHKLPEFKSFLKSLPGYYVYKNYVFCHADIGYFNFKNTPMDEFIYGSYPTKKVDTDKEYQQLFKKGKNKHILIRGHVIQKSLQKFVFSLEEGQAFAGNLVILPMDALEEDRKTMSCKKAFDKNVKRKKSNFNFDKKVKEMYLYPMNELITKKLATEKLSPDGLMKLYKYSKSVFFENKWAEGGYPLLKARGLVLDLAGNIIQHPFDKIFNYRENDTGLDIPDDEVIQYVEKMNGFLGNITLNPFDGSLLVTTTGSFDSTFVGFIKEMIPDEGVLKKFLNENNLTLSFEVIHPEDPHIIKYEEFGLNLIGARGKGWNDHQLSEDDLDRIALDLGLKRPAHGYCTFGELKALVKESKIEGFMVKKDDIHLLKIKTPFYLVTKFLGRMGAANIAFMFANPEKFKERVDEEFYPLVDLIVGRISKEKYLTLSNEEKITFVRELIEKDIL